MTKRSWILAALAALLAAATACGPDGDTSTDVLDEGTLDAVAETTDPGAGGYYPPTATPQQIAALKQLNLFREAVGVAPVDEDERLNQSSQAHAEFIVKNCSNYASSGLSPHNENAAWGDGYTGDLPWDRMGHFGYQAPGMSEVIAFLNSPAGSVTGWIDTLYHRLPLIDPTTIEVGYGGAAGGGPCSYPMLKAADVMDIGMSGHAVDQVVLYPPADAKAVPICFDGYESPTPKAPPGGFPSGYIATVQFGSKVGFKVIAHKLLAADGTALDHVFLAPFADPANGITKDALADDWVALYADKPLETNRTYTVVIDFEQGGKALHVEWSFTTGSKTCK